MKVRRNIAGCLRRLASWWIARRNTRRARRITLTTASYRNKGRPIQKNSLATDCAAVRPTISELHVWRQVERSDATTLTANKAAQIGSWTVTVATSAAKTVGKRLRITVSGDLSIVIDRIRARKLACHSKCDFLVVNEAGERLMRDALRFRFDRARLAARVEKDLFQFRDMRTKAGTDKTESASDIRAAQLQLGHKSLKMTEHYVRERTGDKVGPTR